MKYTVRTDVMFIKLDSDKINKLVRKENLNCKVCENEIKIGICEVGKEEILYCACPQIIPNNTRNENFYCVTCENL